MKEQISVTMAAVLAAALLAVAPLNNVSSTLLPQAFASGSANDLAMATGLAASDIAFADLGTSSQQGVAIQTAAVGGFPTQDGSFAVLSSGCADDVFLPNSEGSHTCFLDGLNTSQGRDLVQLTLVLNVPSGATSVSFDWKFYSDEYPEYVGTAYNDAFLAEMGSSNIILSGNTITAPNNIAFDSFGQLITINTSGALGMTAADAAGTTYDGATPALTTTAPVPSGAANVTLIFSVFDMGDDAYDSTVFIDNIHFDTTGGGGGPTTKKASDIVCAVPSTAEEGSTVNVSATLTDATTISPIAGETVNFSLLPSGPSVNATTDITGTATASLDLTGITPGIYSVKAAFAGNSLYQQDSCESAIEVTQVVPPNNAPVITTPADGATFTVTEGNALSIDVVAVDADAADTVTINASSSVGTFASIAGNPANGTFSWTTSSTDAGTYSVAFGAQDNNGASATPVVVTIVVVDDPTLDATAGKVTSGGAQTSKGTNFGFNVQSNGTSVTGQLQYNDKGANINLHSVKMTFLHVSASGQLAKFTGTATVNGQAGYTFVVVVEDNGEPGRSDSYTIEIPELGYTSTGTLVKGNVQIHT